MLQKQGELKAGLSVQLNSDLPDIKPIRKHKKQPPKQKKIPVASDLAKSQMILEPVQEDIEQHVVTQHGGFSKLVKGKVSWKLH